MSVYMHHVLALLWKTREKQGQVRRYGRTLLQREKPAAVRLRPENAQSLLAPTKKPHRNPMRQVVNTSYSHSIVAGGLEEMS